QRPPSADRLHAARRDVWQPLGDRGGYRRPAAGPRQTPAARRRAGWQAAGAGQSDDRASLPVLTPATAAPPDSPSGPAAECRDVSARSFAEYLSGMGERALVALLQARPDVLAQPVPRGFGQLAQRLSGAESLGAALSSLNRDMLIVGQAIVALGTSATLARLSRLLDASEQAVRD